MMINKMEMLLYIAPCPGGSMVEHQTSNLRVVGSSPTSDEFFIYYHSTLPVQSLSLLLSITICHPPSSLPQPSPINIPPFVLNKKRFYFNRCYSILSIPDSNKMDGRCAICSQEFDEDEHIPRLIPSCGLSYCQKCIIEAQYDPNCCFECPIDNEFHSLAYQVDTLPINIALIKTLGDLKTISFKEFNSPNINTVSSTKSLQSCQLTPLVFSSSTTSANAGQKCPYHNKPKEFRCKQDNQYICSHCILFGAHQNHQIQSINKGAARVNKERMGMLFQEVVRRMGLLDLNIKEFLQPPNSFVKNLDNLRKELKYEVKRKFKGYHEAVAQKEQQIEREIEEVIQGCHSEMEEIESQLNVQYSTICCIKQQINAVKSEIQSDEEFPHPSVYSQKKIEEILARIGNTSDQLVRMNEEIVEKCNEIEREYKEKINGREFVRIKETRVSLVDNRDGDGEEYNLMDTSDVVENSRFIGGKSRSNSRKQNMGESRTYHIKSHKPSMFAPSKFQAEVDTLPQSSYLQPPPLQSSIPYKTRGLNTISQFTLRTQQVDLTKSVISTPSPTKNLHRYKSAYLDTPPDPSSLSMLKPSDSLLSLNRSKIQSIKDQQQKRQTGKLQMRKKVSKILESIESQKGTTLELIGMDIKDYYINQIFNYIKKSNRKYGLIKLVKNQITDEGFNKILNQLKDYEYAHTLNLTSNCLTEECLEWIADFGAQNRALKNLYLKNNQISHIRTKEKKQQITEAGINLYY